VQSNVLGLPEYRSQIAPPRYYDVAVQPSFHRQESQFARAFAVIREAIAQRAFPGAALAVTHQGALIAAHGFGRLTYDPVSLEVHAGTVYDLASVTKVVATTTMAMLLYERGQLQLEAPVAEVLPEFFDFGPTTQAAHRREVTVRMLLAHSSGLPAYVKLFETAQTREQLLCDAFATPLAGAPGSEAVYSDIGFILLGELLARIAQASLDVFTQREVFAPLGMKLTCFNPPPTRKKQIPPTEDDRTFRHRVIQGEVNDENASVMNGVSGHAGLFAPAPDMALFAECMLRGGAPVFQPATVELFTRREDSPPGTSRALGWDTPSQPSTAGAHFSPRSFGHIGFTGTTLWIDPARRLGVTMLTNRIWPDRGSRAIRQVWPLVHDAIVEAL
jgi:CubicO group peptidase (beta-lactamase class C family)